MSQKIKINQNKFRIKELADKLKIKKSVIKFWRKEFNLKPVNSSGKQCFYTQKDFKTLLQIKDLLYNKKFTISKVKTEFKQLKSINTATMAEAYESKSKIVYKEVEVIPKDFLHKVSIIKKQLNELMLKL